MLFIKKQCAVILKNVMDDEMEEFIMKQSLQLHWRMLWTRYGVH